MSQNHRGPYQVNWQREGRCKPEKPKQFGGGTMSYACLHGRHTMCTKLSCPCTCHDTDDETEAKRGTAAELR